MTSAMEHDRVPVPRRRWWLKRIAAGYLLLVVLVMGARWWAVGAAEGRLEREVTGYRLRGEQVMMTDFKPPPVANEQNAAWYLKRAAEAAERIDVEWDEPEGMRVIQLVTAGQPVSAEEREALRAYVERHRQTLELIRQARGAAGVDWGISYEGSIFEILLPHLNDTRHLANLSRTASVAALEEGNDAEALRHVQDIFAIAETLSAEPFFISHLVRIGVESVGVTHLQAMLPRVSLEAPAAAAELQALLEMLVDEQSLHSGGVRMLHGERAAQLDLVMRLAEGEMALLDLDAALQTGRRDGAGHVQRAAAWLWRPILLADGTRVLQVTSAVAEATAQPDWPSASAMLPAVPPPGSGPAPVLEMLTRTYSMMMMPSYGRGVQTHYNALNARRQAVVAAAQRLFEAEHGRRPQETEELVPLYLPAVPLDPLAEGNAPVGVPFQIENPQPDQQ